MKRFSGDDPSVLRRRTLEEQTGDTPLFGDWPERPPAGNEQREMALQGTTEARFLAWLATAEGARFYVVFCGQLLSDARDGRRVSAKYAWEVGRRETKVKADNRFHALAIRRAEEEYPELQQRAEKRKRKSA